MTNYAQNDSIKWGDKMDFYTKVERLSNKDFKQIIGVEKATFDAMVMILKEAYARKPKKWRGGRKKKLTM
ncbi:MAG: hypothetical protein K2I93_09265, partial [Oscillospiraceae bacterium]|nr:hypothetical protein [Oscillospiraceae bacterium]